MTAEVDSKEKRSDSTIDSHNIRYQKPNITYI